MLIEEDVGDPPSVPISDVNSTLSDVEVAHTTDSSHGFNTDEESFNIGDHVVVCYKSNKRDRLFVGNIIKKNSNSFQIKFLRKRVAKKQTYFVYPDIEDKQTVKTDDIIKKVRVRDIRRDRFVVSGMDITLIE